MVSSMGGRFTPRRGRSPAFKETLALPWPRAGITQDEGGPAEKAAAPSDLGVKSGVALEKS